MILDQEKFVSLSRLSSHFGLPERYLKELSDKGLIPCLNVNGRPRFNVEGVQTALDKLASKGASNGR
jgi:hypothetical protein